MKSIFKKIAFVLALAMVVTMMPAKAAAAAESDGPQMYSTLRLYIGGDATGKYEGERFAKVWNWKDDYATVSFGSDNTEVATVNEKSGKVTAVGVGTATVTATFTAEDGSVVNKTCVVTVKKNAVVAGLSSASTKQVTETGIAAGESVQLTAVRKDADGNTVWNGRDVITDGVRFASSNTDVFTVTKTTGKITGVAEGEATLYVWAVQSEGKDPVTGEYPATTEKKEYTVKVYTSGILSVKQLSTTKVAITCGNADTAAAIAEDFSKLEASYKLGENDIKTYIKSAAVSSDDAKVVEVELYTAMVKDTVYSFTYDDTTVSLTAVDPDAIAAIRITTTQAKVLTDTEIVVEFLDANGVVINAGTNALTFTTENSNDYSLYQTGNAGYIYFFEAGKTATVTATYDMGYDDNGNELPDLTASAVIVSKVASDADNFTGYAAATTGATASGLSYSTGVLSLVKGELAQLYAKYTTKNYDGTTSTYYNTSASSDDLEGGNFYFKYVSTNDAIVLVDETTGILHPVATGVAQIIIYRVVGDDEVVVGAVAVSVESSRVFTSFSYSQGNTKISTAATDVWFTVSAKDQLSGWLTDDITYSAKLLSTSFDGTIELYDGWGAYSDSESGSVTLTTDYQTVTPCDITSGGWMSGVFGIKATTTSTSVQKVQISLQAYQASSNVTKTVVLTFTVKVPSDTISSYSLGLGSTAIDVNLPQASSWWSDLTSKITLKAYDSYGYFIQDIAMENITNNSTTLSEGAYGYSVTKGSTYIPVANQTFSPVTQTVSGAAVTYSKLVDGTSVASVGTYTVRVYQGVVSGTNSINRQIAVGSIVVSDSTSSTLASISNTKVAGTSEEVVLADLQAKLADGTLAIKRDGSSIDAEIIGVKCQDRAEADRVYVEYITVRENITSGKYAGSAYEYTVTVGKVFYVQ